ncbi:single-stranded DNA-binding protein [Alicyclobacillus tolerans]|uniref:single-stranded DNA-binding protein n=1 Tax=Alicyclobacillus tolerans TaxID=90970 RepID=UPI001F0028A0|nr:single-stranded DNA-binding protein [Alicyclobacillus tolerans]MCF8568431.1 single-stranded DNA-binding protein [Alicyclobacillus tolerans]
MMNRVILIGRLTADPELRYTNSGTAVASFTLAVDRARKNQQGERGTDFVNIVVWQKQAETCAQYLHKGRMAGVDGRLQIRSYENSEGRKVRVAEVVAEHVRFLDKGERVNSPSGQSDGGEKRTSSAVTPMPTRYNDDPFADDIPSNLDDDPFADSYSA